jgi:hypothetical protein
MAEGGINMKKVLLGIILFALAIVVPAPATAEVEVNIGIGLPPPIVFSAPPAVIVLPDTDFVYVDPDIEIELFFWNGWWWRFWEGWWYRSHYYNRGWVYYRYVPRFYYDVDPGWRRHYREHEWYGHRWNYERIPDRQLQQNWRKWRDTRHWERHGTWGVRDYHPRPHQQMQEMRRERREQYLRRPEVRRHQQEMQPRQGRPRVQQPRQGQPRVQQPRPVRPQVRPGERRRIMRPQGGPAGGVSSPTERRRQGKPEKEKRPDESEGR